MNPIAFTLISGTYFRYRGVSNNHCHPKIPSRQSGGPLPPPVSLIFFGSKSLFFASTLISNHFFFYLSHGAHLRRHGTDSLSIQHRSYFVTLLKSIAFLFSTSSIITSISAEVKFFCFLPLGAIFSHSVQFSALVLMHRTDVLI